MRRKQRGRKRERDRTEVCEMREFKELLDERCLSEEPAFCTAECPFCLDVREFIAKAEKGSFRAAFRMYAETVGFPGIVASFCDAPCEKKCIRREADKEVQLSLLERSVFSMVSDRRPNNYFMPPKDKKIVIIGGGLSGLGCALKCCWQKYHVEIYEQSDRLGGSLWEKDPSGSFLEEIRERFMYEKPVIRLNTRVDSLEELKFDACYIATGKDGDRFGQQLSGNGVFASGTDGVFLGGELTGRTPMEALADGLEAVYAIERFVKTGLMNHPEKKTGTRLKMNPELIAVSEPVSAKETLAGKEGLFGKEEIMKEAGRCLKCRCDACLKGCDLMNFYKKYPRRIEEEVEITIHPGTLSGNGTVATRLIATCSHCGRCATVCPQGIDVGKFLLANHNIMRAKGAMPRVFHEFWLKDMEFSMGEEASLLLLPRGTKTVKRVLFTGCRIGGTMTDTVKKLYAALLQKEESTALWLSCCGLPAQWAGEEKQYAEIQEKIKDVWESMGRPEVLCACESCLKSFRENIPEMNARSVYPLLDAGKTARSDNGSQYCVFDPCAAAKDPQSGKAVRRLAESMGLSLSELPRNGAYASCCSFGGHTAVSNPHYTEEVVKARAGESSAPYITYCANCRDVFVQAGKPAVHILELLFGDGKPDLLRETPTPSASRENRRRLKEELLKEYGSEQPEEQYHMSEKDEKIRLKISGELLEKIGRERLLTEDVEEVVRYCEESGNKVWEEETGIFSGHKMIGCATVWVSYLVKEDGSCELVNTWWHRMQITER